MDEILTLTGTDLCERGCGRVATARTIDEVIDDGDHDLCDPCLGDLISELMSPVTEQTESMEGVS